MKNRIEHPKVFISYAWGSQEHDEKVIALATNLKGDGVDVVFDKCQLKEGNDTFKFMEKSVLDESITNGLILMVLNNLRIRQLILHYSLEIGI